MSSWLASGRSDPFWGVDVMGLAGVVVLEKGWVRDDWEQELGWCLKCQMLRLAIRWD